MALLLASPQAGETRKVETERMITFCFASVWGESNLEGVTGVSYQALRLIVHLARAPEGSVHVSYGLTSLDFTSD
jgi:hypothetical protein